MGLSHPRFITADVGMAAPEAVDEQSSLRESQAMMWHSIEDLKRYCCIMPQPGHPPQSVGRCNEESECIACAALAQFSTSDDQAYSVAEEMKIMLQGSVDDPQSPLKEIEEGTEWHDFYLKAMMFLSNNKYARKVLCYLGHRALPLPEIAALACQKGLLCVWVEIRLFRNQYMVRVTKAMSSKLYAQWHIQMFPDFHKRHTSHMNADNIGSAVQAAMGIAWVVQYTGIEQIMKWVFLSQEMQTSLDTYAAACTRENRDAEIPDFNGSTGSASVKQQNSPIWFKEFEAARKEQTGPCVASVPAATGQEVSTAGAMAVPFVEADVLSSPSQVPAGTIVILPENVLKFKRRLSRIDRCVKIAQTNLATIRKSLYIESDCDDASSSDDHCEENLLVRYIKKGLIVQWDCTQLPIAKLLNKIGDEAKVNWPVSQFTEFVANKLHEQLPKYDEVVAKTMTILRYARPRHAGKRHYYLVPLQNFISNVESALDLADSISTYQIVSLAAHHKDSHGRRISQLALVESI